MASISLESLDLNLLLVLDALGTERNVTRAAARVGLSQPALSNALARLRRLFDDPLFERVRGEMQPTARARSILAAVGAAIAGLREAIETKPSFNPSVSARDFVIITNDALECELLPPLLASLRRFGPGLTLRTARQPAIFRIPEELLASGAADMAIGYFAETLPMQGTFTEQLGEDRLVCVVRRRNRLVRARLDARTFAKLEQVRVIYASEERSGTIDALLRSRRETRRVGATVPHFQTVLDLVAESDLAGVVPERLARRREKALGLRVFPMPIAVPPLRIVAAWNERKQFDAGHAWFRDIVRDALRV